MKSWRRSDDYDDDTGNNSIHRYTVRNNVRFYARSFVGITVGEEGRGKGGVNGIYANRGDFKLRFL